MRLTSSLLGTLALVPCALALVGCNMLLPQQFCELGAECDEGLAGIIYDPVLGDSDDNAAVCTANQQTYLNALRANSEDLCHEAAAAWEAWMACAVQEGCDAFRIDERECKSEREDYADVMDRISRDKDVDCNE